MNLVKDIIPKSAGLVDAPRSISQAREPIDGHLGRARAPGVLDVMGGIGEDSGSLVLTTTVCFSAAVGAMRTAEPGVAVRFGPASGDGGQALELPSDLFEEDSIDRHGFPGIVAACRCAGFPMAAIPCLVIAQGIAERRITFGSLGWSIRVEDDFPPDVDLGYQAAVATAAVEAVCRAVGLQLDSLTKARWVAASLQPLTGLTNLRAPLTALCTPPDAGLMQLRFQPQIHCEVFDLPPTATLVALHTSLERPTTKQRLVDAWLCGEMARRMVAELREKNGLAADPLGTRLAAITPAEFVEHFRNDLPTRITGKTYLDRFGGLRGVNGELDPQREYKVRSRAEHHIYENRRGHDFATWLARSRRTNEKSALQQAGELMYASHWSHSQRCGIGGLEADIVVNAIREHGPDAGLYGAKVTGGGAGGEIVVLMRDDPASMAVLERAMRTAEERSNRPVLAARGRLPGPGFLSSIE